MTTAPERPHTPAWKKLGLKLKFAKEVDSTGGTQETGNHHDGPNKSVNGSETRESTKKGKKRRLDQEEKPDPADAEDGQKTKKKKKRVSFSADTKDRDGDSDQEGGGVSLPSSNGTATDSGPETGNTEEEADSSLMKEEKKEKKKEKRKSRKAETTDSSTESEPKIHEPPILSYLSLYHKNRPAWKFQKNRETQLFKHVFSVEEVPAVYNPAILAYIRGLKSEGAKERLYQRAEEIVKGDLEKGAGAGAGGEGEGEDDKATSEENGGTDPAQYNKAVETFRSWLLDPKEEFDYTAFAGSEDIRKKLEARERAELVLFAVKERLFSVEKPKPEVKHEPKKLTANQRKRKNRTAIVEISSSSESESDSDSDSDSSDSASKSSSDSDSGSDSSSDSDSDTSSSGSSSP